MAEEQANNVAPAEDTQTSESVATPNTNEETTNTGAEQKAPESVSPYLDKMSEDDRKSLDSFLANNGGMKAFNKWKESVSNPEKQEADKPAEEPKKEEPQQVAQQPQRPTKGTISPSEFLTREYFKSLAGEEQYKDIAKEIASGEVLKDMAKFNINPVDQNGYLNDELVRDFLDMKAKTVPPKAPETTTSSTTPTVDYVEVGKEITSAEEAMKVLSQPGHDRHDDALKFLAKGVNGGDK